MAARHRAIETSSSRWPRRHRRLASDIESAGDYEKAYTAYRSITKSSSGTKAADAAAKAMADIEKKGMLGFESKCAACREQKHACQKHKKKPPA